MTVKSKTTINKLAYICADEQGAEIDNILDIVRQILVEKGLMVDTLQLLTTN